MWIHDKALRKIRDLAPDGVMSYSDCRQYMNWWFKFGKHETTRLLNEMQDLGLIKRGKHGIKILEVKDD